MSFFTPWLDVLIARWIQ